MSKMPKKTILFITRPLSPPWDEASKNFAYDLACNIPQSNITILIDKLIADAPAHITQKKIYTTNHFSFLQKIRLVTYILFHAQKYDTIHLLFTPTKLNSTLLKCILKNKKVRVIQTIATVRDDLYNTTDLKKMYFGDMLVTYSRWAKDKLTSMGFAHVQHIYPGINLSKFTPQPKDLSLMNQWHIDPSHIIITYPGEYVRLGASDTIIDAFLKIWQDPKNAHIRYLCACRVKNTADTLKKKEIMQKIADAGHTDKVIFTDTFANMNAIYNLSDIVIFPVENMHGKFDVPLAMIEPYACKKPVITSNLPLFAEFSRSDINVIIPKGQKEALVHAILTLAANTAQQKDLGEHAYTFAHDTFNIRVIAQHYGHLYEQTSQQNQ